MGRGGFVLVSLHRGRDEWDQEPPPPKPDGRMEAVAQRADLVIDLGDPAGHGGQPLCGQQFA